MATYLNETISSAPTTPISKPNVPVKPSPSTSNTTRGGCTFDSLIGGMQYYVCDNSLLLNLAEEETTNERATSDKRATTNMDTIEEEDATDEEEEEEEKEEEEEEEEEEEKKEEVSVKLFKEETINEEIPNEEDTTDERATSDKLETTDDRATSDTDTREITNRRVTRLINHVNQILKDLETQDKVVESFYIGKTYVKERQGKPFNKMDHETWIKEGIGGRWREKYRKEGYDGLIVLTIVTKELVPPKKNEEQKSPDQQMYALMLEQRLLHYYCIENYDPRIKNTSFNEGMKSSKKNQKSDEEDECSGHPLYIAVKFKKQNDISFTE